jgi:glutathione synthase/RimK-type ligase-like ATP-grasp enzyme
MSQAERAWAADEARHGFGGVLSALDCRWVNHPSANARAAYKPHQLATAVACGLRVPRTLITNDPAAGREFVAGCSPGAVYKPLYGSPVTPGWGLYTAEVSAEDAAAPTVAATAHLFQERIEKAFEVRLTVVGEDRMFAARIDASTAAARADWRTDYDALTFTPIEVPEPIAAGAVRLMRRLDLRYGAIDFIVSPGEQPEDWVFLEINANGQYGFVEKRAGLPIAAAIADDLQGDA